MHLIYININLLIADLFSVLAVNLNDDGTQGEIKMATGYLDLDPDTSTPKFFAHCLKDEDTNISTTKIFATSPFSSSNIRS